LLALQGWTIFQAAKEIAQMPEKGLTARIADAIRPASTATRIEAEENLLARAEGDLENLRQQQAAVLLQDTAEAALKGAEKIDGAERRVKIHRDRLRALRAQLRNERIDDREHQKQQHVAKVEKLSAERAIEASRIDRALREVRSAIHAFEQKNAAISQAWRSDLYPPYWTAPSSKLSYHFASALGALPHAASLCLELLGGQGELGSVAVLDANNAASVIADLRNETIPPLPDDDDEGLAA
jgi:hypothetical protein